MFKKSIVLLTTISLLILTSGCFAPENTQSYNSNNQKSVEKTNQPRFIEIDQILVNKDDLFSTLICVDRETGVQWFVKKGLRGDPDTPLSPVIGADGKPLTYDLPELEN